MLNRDENKAVSEAVRRITIIEKWLRRLESMIIRPTGSGTLHDAVTVEDTATLNLTLTGQSIKGDVIGGSGDMTKAVYDIDNDGIVDKSETVDDGAGNSSTATDVKDAVTKKHTQGTDVALGAVGTKNPPIDADKALYRDSAAADALVTSTWTQVKAFLKTYFDTIYAAITHASQHAVSGADTIFPADPGADRYLMWDDVPGELVWSSPAGAGDVVGPASATDGNLAVFDGVTGKLIKDGGAVPAGSADGWNAISGTFTYASASTINVSSGAASIYNYGDRIRFQNNDSGTYLYAYIVGIADTLLTVLGNAVPNATLTDAYYSKQDNPIGFPFYFQYTATVTSGAGSFTTVAGTIDYFIIGKDIFIDVGITITTNGTAANNIRCTIPINPVRNTAIVGREMAVTGVLDYGNVNATTGIFIVTATGTYPGGNGYVLNLKGSYRYVA